MELDRDDLLDQLVEVKLLVAQAEHLDILDEVA